MGLQTKKTFANLVARVFKATTSTLTTATITTLTATTGTITTFTLGVIRRDNKAATVGFVVGTEAANVINVACTVSDFTGTTMAEASSLSWYLASDATGLVRDTTAPSVGTSIGTNGSLTEYVAQLSGMVTTTAAGLFDLDIEEAGVATWYLVCVMPDGSLQVSSAITFA
jgi:hypothetical protein